MNFPYLTEFLTIVVIHLLAVASPGPDFAIVVRQSLFYGQRIALWTSVGIGVGILIHIAYSLLGIGILISQSVLAFTILKVLGSGYLLFIGFKCIREKAANNDSPSSLQAEKLEAPTDFGAFRTGFLTNALNPKVTLFFLSLFSVVISPHTPSFIQALYGLWMLVATILWFSAVSLFFSSTKVRQRFRQFGYWLNRLTGGALIALGIKLALTQAH